MGEIACGYADGSLTAEQVLLSNYIRIKIWKEIQYIPGAITVVGLGHVQVSNL